MLVGVAQTSRRAFPMSVKITTRPNGPYLVEGEIELLDPTGAKINTEGQPRIALCRCGQSSNKPMCDGTHNKVGFQAAEAAKK
jgi:CDGSH-type Zn-finger protein